MSSYIFCKMFMKFYTLVNPFHIIQVNFSEHALLISNLFHLFSSKQIPMVKNFKTLLSRTKRKSWRTWHLHRLHGLKYSYKFKKAQWSKSWQLDSEMKTLLKLVTRRWNKHVIKILNKCGWIYTKFCKFLTN